MQQFRLDLSKEESQQLLTKYDLKNNGTFAYCDFIQNCVLLLRATETSLMRRLKIQNTHKMVGSARGGPGLSPQRVPVSPPRCLSPVPPHLQAGKAAPARGVCMSWLAPGPRVVNESPPGSGDTKDTSEMYFLGPEM